jgi:hypothetical protein
MEDLNVLIKELEELAEELEKEQDADIYWLKYQGPLVRAAIIALQEK